MQNAFDRSEPFSKANFPFWGMCSYLVGSTLLTGANWMAHAGTTGDHKTYHAALEILGGTMFIVGTMFYLKSG